ncbi:unnamed protein product (macronuclear) [Paramecium tetraurelia]|uniref:AD domain-containing protein n=1 Tax=Paramecium tetraurelia TaxID=5888 RepID=A0BC77_PARTE|nr:uncharacterized protein GSPATT00004238001 [Paramecium tetraurelia]CAK56144.1 unnamed protein product [Paramecium tetraurelia]|eukprot:XP_001423542.1 hypothetical protein (macronuclear) [Paramecium tetraurelia strain d4-2]
MSKQQWTLLTTDTQKLQLFGMQARVTTNYGDVFQGLIYYCDESIIILSMNEIAIKQKMKMTYFQLISNQYKIYKPLIFKILKYAFHQAQQTLQNLLAIDLAAMAQEMIKKEMKEPHQQLFDHLQKLYRDVDWKDQEIIIPSISIRISPPYKSNNISGENKLGVERLRKIVDKYAKNF